MPGPPGSHRDVLVGDLDSVSPDGLAWAKATIAVERHPADKAATDTELALRCAAAMRPDRLVLLAGQGDRIDHAIAAIGALGGDDLADVPSVEAWWGADNLLVARPGRPAVVTQPPGTTFSVLALHGPCPRRDGQRVALAVARRRSSARSSASACPTRCSIPHAASTSP